MKLRAESFWIDRWWGSSAAFLPLEMRGLYRELLSASWLQGASLPNDPEALRRFIRATDDEWSRCWPTVRRYWRKRDDGRLVNDTQIEIYARVAAIQHARSAASRVRWDRVAMQTKSKRDAKPNAKRDAKHHRKRIDQDQDQDQRSGSGSEVPIIYARVRARRGTTKNKKPRKGSRDENRNNRHQRGTEEA